MQLIGTTREADYRTALARLIEANTTPDEAYAHWVQLENIGFPECGWIRLISPLHIARSIPSEQWRDLCTRYGSVAFRQLFINNRIDLLYEDPALRDRAFASLLSCSAKPGISAVGRDSGDSWIETALIAFGALTNVINAVPTRLGSGLTLREVISRHFVYRPVEKPRGRPAFPSTPTGVARFAREVDRLLDEPVDKWRTSLEPWTALVEVGRQEFGEAVAWRSLAVVAAGIRSKAELGTGGEDAFDSHVPVTVRARFARLRAGSAAWWADALERASNFEELQFILLLTIRWASQKSLSQLAEPLGRRLDMLDDWQWATTASIMKSVLGARTRFREAALEDSGEFSGPTTSTRLLYLISLQSQPGRQISIYRAALGDYVGNDRLVATHRAHVALLVASIDPIEWSRSLEAVKHAYQITGRLHLEDVTPFSRDQLRMPLWVATVISERSDEYPISLIELADIALAEEAGKIAKKVGEVAQSDGWFAAM